MRMPNRRRYRRSKRPRRNIIRTNRRSATDNGRHTHDNRSHRRSSTRRNIKQTRRTKLPNRRSQQAPSNKTSITRKTHDQVLRRHSLIRSNSKPKCSTSHANPRRRNSPSPRQQCSISVQFKRTVISNNRASDVKQSSVFQGPRILRRRNLHRGHLLRFHRVRAFIKHVSTHRQILNARRRSLHTKRNDSWQISRQSQAAHASLLHKLSMNLVRNDPHNYMNKAINIRPRPLARNLKYRQRQSPP